MLYICDFETTVDEDTAAQTESEVWAYGFAQLFDGTEDVTIGNNIGDFFEAFAHGRKQRHILYFVNLKFDGSFIIDYLQRELNYLPAYDDKEHKFDKPNELAPGTFTTLITDLGIWYNIIVNYKGYILEFRDLLKLLPFSVKDLGKAFDTKHRKLEMEYKGNMRAGGEITPEQEDYIRNDILVPKEALEKFLNEIGYERVPPLTIGQWALAEFKKTMSKEDFELFFPNLADIEIDKDTYGSSNIDEYVRRSYFGGWCYADEKYTGLINGFTKVFDVNSLYPSVMRDHKNKYPVGLPVFIKDPARLKDFPKDSYYFIRFRCRFDLRAGYLPFIQIKHDINYRTNENLSSSHWDRFGHSIREHKPELTLSKIMFELFAQCYIVRDLEILDICIFNTETALFDAYIDKFMRLKELATIQKNAVKRTIAKLALNNLYGKFSKKPENSFKVPRLKEDEEPIDYEYDTGEDLKPLYIPIGSAITSYARRFTIKGAIQNKEYFRYADTDSLHLVCPPDYVPDGLEIHDTKLSCWKEESKNEHSIFIRQKTYMEYTGTDFEIKACGLPERCKILFSENLKGNKPEGDILTLDDGSMIKLSKNEIRFMKKDRTIRNFDRGLSIPGKLLPVVVKGGTVLKEVDFTIN